MLLLPAADGKRVTPELTCEHQQRSLDVDRAEQGRHDERHEHGEDGRSHGADAVHEAQPALEVVAENDQRGCVDERGAGAEHQAIRHQQSLKLPPESEVRHTQMLFT